MAVGVLAAVLLPMVGLFVAMFQGDVAERWDVIDGVILDRIAVTLVLALGAAFIALSLAVPFALALRRARFPGRSLLRVLYVVPLLIPPHIQGIAWMRVVGKQGLITEWLAARDIFLLDVRAGFFEIGGSAVFFPGAMWMLVAAFWPLAALIVSAGLSKLDPRAEEAALFAPKGQDSSKGKLLRIWNCLLFGRWFLFLFPKAQRRSVDGVLLALLKPHILAGAFFVFIFSAGCYPIPALLDTPTIVIDIFFSASRIDAATAGVVSVPLVLLTVFALLWVVVMGRGDVFQNRSRPVAQPRSLMPKNLLLGAFAWGLVLVTSGVPLYALLEKAGGIATYRSIWHNVLPDIKNSLWLALFGALIIAVCSTIVALFASRLGRKRGFVVEILALLPFAFPAIVVGVAMNQFWGGFRDFNFVPGFLRSFVDESIYQSSGIFFFCYLTLFLPFGLRCVVAVLKQVDPRQVEAGLLVHRSSWARFRGIVLPILLPGVVAAFLLGFVLSLGELGAGLIVQPPDASTVQIRVFNMIHYSRDDEVAALCVMVVAVTLLPTLIYSLLFNRKVEVL